MPGVGQVGRTWDLKTLIDNYEQRINTLEKLSGTGPATDPLGNLSYVESTTADRTSASAVPVEIVELTASVAIVSGRRYKITAMIVTYSTVSTDSAALQAQVDGVSQGTYEIRANASAGTTAQTTNLTWIYDAAASGSFVVRIMVHRSNGTGTVHAIGSATAPIFCLVEDIGAV